MRRFMHVSLLVVAGVFVLVGVAAATGGHPQTQDVSAAFTATQTRMHTRTCEEGGNTFRVTNAVWRGTSTSAEPRLAGTLVVSTHTVVNETTGDGWMSGSWRTTNTSTANPRAGARPRSHARLSAVIDNANHLDGLANGEARRASARLLGNWSATIVGTTLTGELGANAPVAPDNSALLFRGGC
jgi:hypothetical protein